MATSWIPARRQSTAVANQAGIQTITLTFTGFATPVAGDSYLRCRIANTASEVANPTGAANTGEVEDYKVTIAQQPKDYGDAPDSELGTAQGNYNTQSNDNGPNHVIVSGLSLGSIAPDADPGTLQDVNASADNDDQHRRRRWRCRAPEVTVGSTSVALAVQAINATGSPATVACWIDFNRDGGFMDTGERASAGSAPAPERSGLP